MFIITFVSEWAKKLALVLWGST